MVKKLIYSKVAGSYYLLKPNLNKETNILKVENNVINYDFCFIDNS